MYEFTKGVFAYFYKKYYPVIYIKLIKNAFSREKSTKINLYKIKNSLGI